MSVRQNWRRLNDARRVTGVDLARGLAVLGMLAAHLTNTRAFDWGLSESWSDVVNGRSSILFATLAGVSIALFTGGTTPVRGKGVERAALRLSIRALLLWSLGALLLLLPVPVYVILPAYGILFLLALPFAWLRPGTLFMIAGGAALIMPFVQVTLDAPEFWRTESGEVVASLLGWHYPFTVWIAFVLAGLAVGRLRLDALGVQLALLGTGAALAVVAYGLDAVAPPFEGEFWDELWTAWPHSSGLWEVVGSGGFALGVLGLCLLVCRVGAASIVLFPLRAVGSMPLTAYTAQLVVWAIAGSLLLGDPEDLFGFRMLDPFPWFVLGTVVGCTAWALVVGRGPLEWAIDRICRLIVPDARADRLVT